MTKKYHTVIVGGGCLGTASAISISRHIKKNGGDPSSVCLIEKMVLGGGLTARHSGIVRAANADPNAAEIARIASDMWLNIRNIWDTDLEADRFGAVWIAKKDSAGGNKKWDSLEKQLKSSNIRFNRISYDNAREILPSFINVEKNEAFYHEPDALQYDPAEVRRALYEGVRRSQITLEEKTEVTGFRRNSVGKITEVITSNGVFKCDHVVNAAGAWSPAIFAKLGISIPVSVEPVYVVNWLTSLAEKKVAMPIVADYVNRAYFRSWRDGEIHMHQPRKRALQETSTAFAENPLAVLGADFINDPANQAIGYSQTRVYEDISKQRFSNTQQTIFSSGYRSFFDITPDLRFILGPDSKVPNLIHCLGSGQAFKYAPAFGEMMSEFIFNGGSLSKLGKHFSIGRFDSNFMEEFWKKVSGSEYSLETEGSSL
ncbi:MAG: hypothetical protein CBD16_00650 [Betaproteobacteria bacterium TMED156]|nr:MAG: hypothetical protein CBD16_00650 [Betaproteobacteria bacterium TMED156]